MDNSPDKSIVMIIDDTRATLTQLTEILENPSCQIQPFLDGKQALEATAKCPPDLILLDTALPELSGFEICRQLKADPNLCDIPVIFISDQSETAGQLNAFLAGGSDYITRPFQPEEVGARVQTHLHMRRLQLELNRQYLHVEDLVKEKVSEISDSQIATIFALAKLSESRDDTTGIHIERTRSLCRILAVQLRKTSIYAVSINEAFIESIYQAAPLHDIGKVGIPDNILQKEGPLTSEEFEIIKTHTTIGADTLQSAHRKYPRNAFLNMGIALARSHHERWDGSGYPDGLSGEDIPLSARILAIADVYDGMHSNRSYRAGLTHEECVNFISNESGRRFDPVIVEAFKEVESLFSSEFDRMVAELY